MLKFLFPLCFFAVVHSNGFAQQEPKSPLNDFDEFTSKHDGFIRIEDFNLPRILLQFGVYADTRIRKVTAENEVRFYFQVSEGRDVGSVSAEAMPALIKAFGTLKSEMAENSKPSADYMVYKYSDAGGLQVGYTVEGKKLTWFLRPDKNYSRVFFIKDPTSLEDALTKGGAMLQQLN